MPLSGLTGFLMRRAHRPVRPWHTKLAIALGCIAVATALRWAANPYLALSLPYTFYLPAIVATTALCGQRWGHLTIAISLLLTVYIWIPPVFSLHVGKVDDVSDVIVWAGVSSFIVVILSALDNAVAVRAKQAEELTMKSRALEAQALALADSEAKLRTYAVDLERLVDERTAKLTASVAELESFSYTISHDLRSPLRAMQGFSHLALEEAANALTPKAQNYLRRIDDAAQRMDGLIGDLLLFTRAGKSEAAIEVIDVGALVLETVRQHPNWTSHGALIEVKQPTALVRGRPEPLAQSLANLLDNAVKFVPAERTARVRVWTERRDRRVRIMIRDNGVGFPPEFLNHIYQPFHRGHPGAGYAGRGIGLAIARKNVVHMGGDIGVSTDPGHGSLFWLELPAGEASA